MSAVDTHSQIAAFIWSICNKLRGPYKRTQYRKVILPLTVLRRFDAVLEPTKEAVLKEYEKVKGKSENVQFSVLTGVSGVQFYNTSKLSFANLLADPNNLAVNLNGYINAFSPNVRKILQEFEFSDEVVKMAEKNILFLVVKAFKEIDLSPSRVDDMQMGYIFEELIRIGSEESHEEAGDHFTPREIIKLMVNLLLSDEEDLAKSHVVKTIYDPTCGTGGMLSVAEEYIRSLNSEANPVLYGQDFNDESWAVCKSTMLLKGENAENIVLGDTLTNDGHGDRHFDYMLANPPFGVEWKNQQKFVEDEQKKGFAGRFGAGTPRINDGSLLFLQHMLSKMVPEKQGGSRIGIVFNGSPLFTGDAGSGESEIRKWIITNDWLEGVMALPDQLFYNTGISTYLWILTNRKTKQRRGKVQLLDARELFVKMKKSLGNKRNLIGDGEDGTPDHIATISKLYGDFTDGATLTLNGKEKVVSKVYPNDFFGYRKITVERPLRLNFQASPERVTRLEEERAFQNLATSKKKAEAARQQEIQAGQQRQQELRDLLARLDADHLYTDRSRFLKDLKAEAKATGLKLSASETKIIINALGERDPNAKVCTDKKGNPEPDSELRDTETVALDEDIDAYMKREVLPHVPDAWVDHEKTKVGFEIPLTREFYVYELPRPLEDIEEDIATLEQEILSLLKDVTT